ncbi:hypothetical protein BH23ACT9_BH23ACT9_32040 [soil metagenome]
MADPDPLAASQQRLRALLGGPDLAWLRDRVRRRLAQGRPPTGVMGLSGPSEAQIAAACRLLGRPYRPVQVLRVDLAEVDGVLRRAGLAGGVADAITRLEGPVANERSAREQLARDWEVVLDRLDPLGPPRWTAQVRANGMLKRLAGGDPSRGAGLVDQLARVLDALPAAQVSRSRFAAEVLRDAHALDDGRPLATLARAALDARNGSPVLPGAEGRRETWAQAGVLVGELTSTVLVGGFGPEPRVWTLRQVARRSVDLSSAADGQVWVCENPTVLAEAVDGLGAACPPMVCASGKPTVAVVTLLRILRSSGAVLRYHGDFDWPGIEIANRLISRIGVQPWRFDTAAYETAVAAGRGGRPLESARVEASWDTHLAEAMVAVGRRVEEESVLDTLLSDLRGG